jgi:hypothetical protein
MPKAKRASSTSQSRSRSPSTSSSREKKRPLHQLPFVKSIGDRKSPLYPMDFWAVEETGNGYFDNELGEALADKLVDTMGRHGPTGSMNDLVLITDSMMAKGKDFCRAVRVGFLSRLAYRLIVITRHH